MREKCSSTTMSYPEIGGCQLLVILYIYTSKFSGKKWTRHKILQRMKSASKISVFCILLYFIIERQVDLRHLVVLQLLGFLQLRYTNNWP